jgi:hypothetical protein
MMDNQWARLLAYVTALVNQELLLQNEYLVAENHILKAHLRPGFRLTDSERTTLAEIGKRLGRKALQKVAGIAKPDTLLAWYRRLIAHKFDGSKHRRSVSSDMWTIDSMSRASRRPSQVLLSEGRMNFLTLREEWPTSNGVRAANHRAASPVYLPG